MTIDVFEGYAALDPAEAPGLQPAWSTSAPVHLSAAHGREPIMQTQQLTPTPPRPPKPKHTGWLVAAATFVLILIVGAVVLLSSQSDADLSPAEAPATTVAAQSTGESTLTPGEGLNVANAFYVAFNEGAPEDVMALFAPDATFSDSFSGSVSSEDEKMLFVWNAAQGTKLTSQGCRVEQSGPAPVLVVVCKGETHDAISQAVGAPAVPTDISMVVTPAGITQFRFNYGQPDFNVTGIPFEAWMNNHNPHDAQAAAFGNWTTVDEARAFGLVLAQYAREWAEYLKQNRCSYRDNC